MSSTFDPSPQVASDSGEGQISGKGRISVEGPHWTAELVLVNHRMEMVQRGVGRLEAEALPPGLYDIHATVGTETVYQMVKLAPGEARSISQEAWEAVRFSSAAPLAGTSTSHERHRDPAVKWSRKSTWTPPSGSTPLTSRLFLFVRTLERGQDSGFAEGLELLDCDSRLLVELKDSAVWMDPADGYLAFAADLPPGPYLLRRKGGGRVRARCQALFLCSEWETQVFVPSGRQPSLRRWSVIYAPRGDGFRPKQAEDHAAEAVLAGLRRGRCLVTPEQMERLLVDKLERPWLGVLAAHALLLEAKPEFKLIERVIGVLEARLVGHPDVRALSLALPSPPSVSASFPFPPLLQASLALTRNAAAKSTEIIPVNSLTDCLLESLYTNSPWTGWGTLRRTPLPVAHYLSPNPVSPSKPRNLAAAFDPSEAEPGTAALRGRGPRRLRTVKSGTEGGEAPALEWLAEREFNGLHLVSVSTSTAIAPVEQRLDPLTRLGITRAVQQFRRRLEEAPPDAPLDTLQAVQQAAGLLNPEQVCRTYGISLAHAKQAVLRLQDPQQGLLRKAAGLLEAGERAVLQAFSQEWIEMGSPRTGSESSAVEEQAEREQRVDGLLELLGRILALLPQSGGSSEAVDSLRQARKHLARRTDLLLVTDAESGRPLYANPPYLEIAQLHPGHLEAVPSGWKEVTPGSSLERPLELSPGGPTAPYRVTCVEVADKSEAGSRAVLYHAAPQDQELPGEEALARLEQVASGTMTSLSLRSYASGSRVEQLDTEIKAAARNLLELAFR